MLNKAKNQLRWSKTTKGKDPDITISRGSNNSSLLETFAKHGEEIRKEFGNKLQNVDENKP